MATQYTNLLGFALPVTGELAGTWGDVVNNSITELVEDSIAGTATASVTSGNWTLSTTGSGASNEARCAILVPTGSPGVSRNIIAPSSSKAYIVDNQSNAAVVLKGSATTGVTIAAGTKALCAWNGTDFVQVGGNGTVTSVTGTSPVASSGGTTPAISLASGYGDTQNPYASKTANYVLAAPNGSSGAPTFRAIVAADIPTLNQNTSGTAAGLSSTLVVGSGGTGTTSLTSGYVLIGNNTSAIEASSLLTKSAAVTSGTYIKGIGYADTVVALGNTGTAINLDVVSGGVFSATLTGNATITLRYPVSSGASSFILILTNDATPGRSVAWAGGTFKFPGGAASLSRTTTASAIDIWAFFTPDGGTTWYGNIVMKNMTT